MDDFEGVFEKKICHFIWAKCHIKLNHAIYIYPMNGKQSPHRTKSEVLKSDVNLTCCESHLTITSQRKTISVEKKSNEANQIALHTTKSRLVENVVKNYKMIRMPKYAACMSS